MDDLYFDAHFENLKRDLCVYPEIVFGEQAVEATKKYGSLSNGAYLWKEDEDMIAMRNKKLIGTLAHEVRHSWQYHNKDSTGYRFPKKKQRSRIMKKISRVIYQLSYIYDKKEKDANQFAIEYCRKNGLHKEARRIKNYMILIKFAGTIVPTYLIAAIIFCLLY